MRTSGRGTAKPFQRKALAAQPAWVTTLDGIKIESITRPQPGGESELFFGPDDEHHSAWSRPAGRDIID